MVRNSQAKVSQRMLLLGGEKKVDSDRRKVRAFCVPGRNFVINNRISAIYNKNDKTS